MRVLAHIERLGVPSPSYQFSIQGRDLKNFACALEGYGEIEASSLPESAVELASRQALILCRAVTEEANSTACEYGASCPVVCQGRVNLHVATLR